MFMWSFSPLLYDVVNSTTIFRDFVRAAEEAWKLSSLSSVR